MSWKNAWWRLKWRWPNQEKITEDLNQVIIEQGRMIDRLVKQNQYLMTLAEQDTVKPLSEETPPPHY